MTSTRARHPILVLCAALVATLCVPTVLAAPAKGDVRNTVPKQRRHIRDRAKSQTGTPYRYGGSSTSGFDCSGFTRWAFRRHGAFLPRTSIDQFYLAKKKAHKRIWKRGRLKMGDLVFHKTTSARVGHVGIFVGNGKFISTTSSGGVRVRSIWDPHYWGPRWVGGTRLGVMSF